jgi:hypothetical protein
VYILSYEFTEDITEATKISKDDNKPLKKATNQIVSNTSTYLAMSPVIETGGRMKALVI